MMKHRMIILVSTVASLAFAGSAMAHGGGSPDLYGGVTIWSGGPYGGGYAGSLYIGDGYYAPARHSPRLHYYDACGHWHPRGYRHAAKHAYRHGYAHGYRKAHHRGHHRHHHKHHRHHH